MHEPEYWRLNEQQKELVEKNRGLVHCVIKRLHPNFTASNSPGDYDDVYQIGCLGLMRAAVRFDPTKRGNDGKPAQFKTFAFKVVWHGITVAFRRGGLIYVPVEARLKVEAAIARKPIGRDAALEVAMVAEEDDSGHEKWDELHIAIEELSPCERVWIERRMAGVKLHEIEPGTSRQTMSERLQRLYRRLRERLVGHYA